jgi:superfamily I DNA/RNA helicase
VAAAQSARRTCDEPEILAVDGDELAAAVVATATELADRHATIGVIAPAQLHDEILGAGLPTGEALAVPISLVTPDESKGLEFDAIVVVEPALVAAADRGTSGVRLLYVTMTRAVQHLTVVHSLALPEALA